MDSGSDSSSSYSGDDMISGEFYDPDLIDEEEDIDPEYIQYTCFNISQIRMMLDEIINRTVTSLCISQSLAKLLLEMNQWDEIKITELYKSDRQRLLIDSHAGVKKTAKLVSSYCAVCAQDCRDCGQLLGLNCGHEYCMLCWQMYFETQLGENLSMRVECMGNGCSLYCLEDFALRVLAGRPDSTEKYKKLAFIAEIETHPKLRMCPGKDCPIVVMADREKAKKVTCETCGTVFCVRCGGNYHAPTSCETIRKWLIKCVDDSETANYISAHTKDCPNCHSCIEKNGGCNHMQCAKCKHHFCWMCFGDWKTHGSEYYECSRYKENPAVAQEANHIKARRALEKYLHYFVTVEFLFIERYENHHKSLMLEEELRQSIMKKVEEKVNGHEGTWIDWQHLHRAATLLTKCRYTLQYTYPYAYYMESGSKKELVWFSIEAFVRVEFETSEIKFEYQQAQLEKEIEELSWKVERAESTERGDLESQMHVAELKRRTLLEEFFK
ncbi:unnamed protein product [Enterobius vermicularis]|uniref:RBR-type E3 ubiquitin transferase n=1 Tax=Enterobius vermicularis TaxID=51028 RepID=A0A0N4VDR1_ENTVE|nr:unnamed protein product [Enterobius vermicularis]